MPEVYDNWERLVEATLKRDLLRQLALCDSIESSFNSVSSHVTCGSILDQDVATDEETMSCFKRIKKDKSSSNFISTIKLSEGRCSFPNGADDMPCRVFTSKEVFKAIKGNPSSSKWSMCDTTGYYIKGSFKRSPILVKRSHNLLSERPSFIINDIAISLHMNHHKKNALKILGCCLDYEVPLIIYDHSGNERLLHDILSNRNGATLLSWRHRMKIALDIVDVLVYLHTGFDTPIIHRDLGIQNVVLGQDGVAKLLDFSLCIPLPLGESLVEDMVIGTKGLLDPCYTFSGVINEKSDVFMFGVILLQLSTGINSFHELIPYESVGQVVESNELSKFLDRTILEEIKETENIQQLQAFARLALKCTQYRGEDRPSMIDVAKDLKHIVEWF